MNALAGAHCRRRGGVSAGGVPGVRHAGRSRSSRLGIVEEPLPVGGNRANGVTVALGIGGTLSVTYAAVAGAHAQAIFDVTGYFTP